MKVANRPKFKKYIFAQEATNDTIEPVPDTETATQEAQGYIGYQKGFTINNMKPLTEGGKPPRGQQLNQLLKDITSVTQYATMGGTYDLDKNISADTGYPRNALIVNDSGIYRSLVDDNQVTDLNNKTYWQFVLDFKPPKRIERIIGNFFYSSINLSGSSDVLRCDGSEYNLADYPDLEKYLVTHQVHSLSFKDWENFKNFYQNNLGCFGYEPSLKKFRVPIIQSGTYLSPANMPNGEVITPILSGDYHPDQIVNIIGDCQYFAGRHKRYQQMEYSGVFFEPTPSIWPYGLDKGGDFGPIQFYFNASKSPGVNVGDRVMPRTIFQNLYVVVSEHY